MLLETIETIRGKGQEPRFLADAIVKHIEDSLPEILGKVELPSRMSAVEKERLLSQVRPRRGFRTAPRLARKKLTERLTADDTVSAYAQAQTNLRLRSERTDLVASSGDVLSPLPAHTGSTHGISQKDSVALFFREKFHLGNSGTDQRGQDLDSTESSHPRFEDEYLSPIPPLVGEDLRRKFVIIRGRRLIAISETPRPAEDLPSGAQQLMIPDDSQYACLNMSELLSVYQQTAVSDEGTGGPLSQRQKLKLIEALLHAVELEEQWNTINQRRFHLVTKKHVLGLRRQEAEELENLQRIADRRVDAFAPLPLCAADMLVAYARRLGIDFE